MLKWPVAAVLHIDQAAPWSCLASKSCLEVSLKQEAGCLPGPAHKTNALMLASKPHQLLKLTFRPAP